MSDADRLEARLEALESHIAHQTQIIEELSATVLAQWAVLDGLRRQMGHVTERLDVAETQGAGAQPGQKPPHY